ncbi:MAG: DUF4200 domain-containing protein [Deltaproteobacteria bacterium]|nr:DUF4200 domain-containing protein [Deltaproteobacteria bacterium]
MDTVRYGSLKILTNCMSCGSPLVINGVLRKKLCSSCQNYLVVDEKLWNSLILALDKFIYSKENNSIENSSLEIDGVTLKISKGKSEPHCRKCAAPLPMNLVSSFSEEIACSNCGEKHSIQNAPSWIKNSENIKIIGGEDEEIESAGIRQINPVSMNCPNCSGSLKISQSLDRITVCEFCSGEFYIPDPIWNHLHPVNVANTWYLSFKGKPGWLIEEEKRREIKKREKAEYNRKKALKDREDEMARTFANLIIQINSERRGWKAILFGGYFASLMLGIFLIGFPVIFISPLSKIVGTRICDGEYKRTTHSSGGSTSIKFHCIKNGVNHSLDGKMFLYGPGGGVIFLSTLWTLFNIFRYIRVRKRVGNLQFQLNELKKKMN